MNKLVICCCSDNIFQLFFTSQKKKIRQPLKITFSGFFKVRNLHYYYPFVWT